MDLTRVETDKLIAALDKIDSEALSPEHKAQAIEAVRTYQTHRSAQRSLARRCTLLEREVAALRDQKQI